MPAAQYAIGIDFGTESGRAVLVRVQEPVLEYLAEGTQPDRLPLGQKPGRFLQ